MRRFNLNNIKIPRTEAEYKEGLKNPNVDAMYFPGSTDMTMKGMKDPVLYYGMTGGKVTDRGIAYPGQDFKVKGDSTMEFRLQQGGRGLPKFQASGTAVPRLAPFRVESFDPRQGEPRSAIQLFTDETSRFFDYPDWEGATLVPNNTGYSFGQPVAFPDDSWKEYDFGGGRSFYSPGDDYRPEFVGEFIPGQSMQYYTPEDFRKISDPSLLSLLDRRQFPLAVNQVYGSEVSPVMTDGKMDAQATLENLIGENKPFATVKEYQEAAKKYLKEKGQTDIVGPADNVAGPKARKFMEQFGTDFYDKVVGKMATDKLNEIKAAEQKQQALDFESPTAPGKPYIAPVVPTPNGAIPQNTPVQNTPTNSTGDYVPVTPWFNMNNRGSVQTRGLRYNPSTGSFDPALNMNNQVGNLEGMNYFNSTPSRPNRLQRMRQRFAENQKFRRELRDIKRAAAEGARGDNQEKIRENRRELASQRGEKRGQRRRFRDDKKLMRQEQRIKEGEDAAERRAKGYDEKLKEARKEADRRYKNRKSRRDGRKERGTAKSEGRATRTDIKKNEEEIQNFNRNAGKLSETQQQQGAKTYNTRQNEQYQSYKSGRELDETQRAAELRANKSMQANDERLDDQQRAYDKQQQIMDDRQEELLQKNPRPAGRARRKKNTLRYGGKTFKFANGGSALPKFQGGNNTSILGVENLSSSFLNNPYGVQTSLASSQPFTEGYILPDYKLNRSTDLLKSMENNYPALVGDPLKAEVTKYGEPDPNNLVNTNTNNTTFSNSDTGIGSKVPFTRGERMQIMAGTVGPVVNLISGARPYDAVLPKYNKHRYKVYDEMKRSRTPTNENLVRAATNKMMQQIKDNSPNQSVRRANLIQMHNQLKDQIGKSQQAAYLQDTANLQKANQMLFQIGQNEAAAEEAARAETIRNKEAKDLITKTGLKQVGDLAGRVGEMITEKESQKFVWNLLSENLSDNYKLAAYNAVVSGQVGLKDLIRFGYDLDATLAHTKAEQQKAKSQKTTTKKEDIDQEGVTGSVETTTVEDSE